MLASAIRALTLTTRRSVLARLVAVVCAVAILTVSLVHSFHHLSGTAPVVAVQADTGTLDDSSDISKKAPAAIEHCLACMTATLADRAQPFVRHHVMLDLAMRIADRVRPHTPLVEIPPPISTI